MVPLSNNSSRPLHSCHDLPAGWIMCVCWTLPLSFPRGWTCQWCLRTWCGKRCAYLGNGQVRRELSVQEKQRKKWKTQTWNISQIHVRYSKIVNTKTPSWIELCFLQILCSSPNFLNLRISWLYLEIGFSIDKQVKLVGTNHLTSVIIEWLSHFGTPQMSC